MQVLVAGIMYLCLSFKVHVIVRTNKIISDAYINSRKCCNFYWYYNKQHYFGETLPYSSMAKELTNVLQSNMTDRD